MERKGGKVGGEERNDGGEGMEGERWREEMRGGGKEEMIEHVRHQDKDRRFD